VILLRVAILTWEFPPRIVGNLAFYVDKLAAKLVDKKVDVYVVTFHEGWTGFEQRIDGVKVYRVSNPVKTHINILTWDLTLMVEFMRAFSDIYYSVGGEVDLIDAHEWLCVPAATALKKAFSTPFLYTIHSLEDHRSHYSNEPLNISIKNLEILGSVDADRILVKSEWMRGEVNKLHGAPTEKIDVVPLTSSKWIEEVIKTYEATIESFKAGLQIDK